LVEDKEGWKFRLSATAAKLVVEVDWVLEFETHRNIAPPGKSYIVFVLHIANALPDRPAEFFTHPGPGESPFVGSGGGALFRRDQTGPLFLKVPAADKDAFAGVQVATVCNPLCALDNSDTRVQSFQAARSALHIPVGGSVDLAFFFINPVPSTAPVGHITYHWVWPEGQDISVPIVAG
jgi:hypothetical protein